MICVLRLFTTARFHIHLNLPQEKSYCRDGERSHAHLVESPVERKDGYMRKRSGEPFRVRHLDDHNINPNQETEDENRQDSRTFHCPFRDH